MEKVNVALIGIGGFGRVHTRNLTVLAEEGAVSCKAFAELRPENNRDVFEQLTGMGAKHYTDYQEMLRQHPEVDLVVISTPLPLHKSMSIYAMEQGFHVLLEKPPAVTLADYEAIVQTRNRTGRLCQVNFQNTSGEAFRLMLRRLREGAIGRIQSVTGVGKWKRTQSYYDRSPWAGKLFYRGEYVLDGSMMNALSHLLNNALFAAGYGQPADAEPVSVTAELYSAGGIESENTACVRMQTKNGVEVRYYTTLCHENNETPYLLVCGERGWMRWNYKNELTIGNENGDEEQIRMEPEDLPLKMCRNMLDALRGKAELYCPVEACRSYMLAANGAFESSGKVHPLAGSYVTRRPDGDTTEILINGISGIIDRCAEEGLLFSEAGIPWGVRTEPVSLEGFRHFRRFGGQ